MSSTLFGRLITDLLCFQEVVEKNLKKRRVGAESVDSTASASSNLEPFANDELGTFLHKTIRVFRAKTWTKLS